MLVNFLLQDLFLVGNATQSYPALCSLILPVLTLLLVKLCSQLPPYLITAIAGAHIANYMNTVDWLNLMKSVNSMMHSSFAASLFILVNRSYQSQAHITNRLCWYKRSGEILIIKQRTMLFWLRSIRILGWLCYSLNRHDKITNIPNGSFYGNQAHI